MSAFECQAYSSNFYSCVFCFLKTEEMTALVGELSLLNVEKGKIKEKSIFLAILAS